MGCVVCEAAVLQPLSFLQIFVSRSYDATSHFETECEDIKDMYRRLTGSEFSFGDLRREQFNESDDD